MFSSVLDEQTSQPVPEAVTPAAAPTAHSEYQERMKKMREQLKIAELEKKKIAEQVCHVLCSYVNVLLFSVDQTGPS